MIILEFNEKKLMIEYQTNELGFTLKTKCVPPILHQNEYILPNIEQLCENFSQEPFPLLAKVYYPYASEEINNSFIINNKISRVIAFIYQKLIPQGPSAFQFIKPQVYHFYRNISAVKDKLTSENSKNDQALFEILNDLINKGAYVDICFQKETNKSFTIIVDNDITDSNKNHVVKAGNKSIYHLIVIFPEVLPILREAKRIQRIFAQEAIKSQLDFTFKAVFPMTLSIVYIEISGAVYPIGYIITPTEKQEGLQTFFEALKKYVEILNKIAPETEQAPVDVLNSFVFQTDCGGAEVGFCNWIHISKLISRCQQVFCQRHILGHYGPQAEFLPLINSCLQICSPIHLIQYRQSLFNQLYQHYTIAPKQKQKKKLLKFMLEFGFITDTGEKGQVWDDAKLYELLDQTNQTINRENPNNKYQMNVPDFIKETYIEEIDQNLLSESFLLLCHNQVITLPEGTKIISIPKDEYQKKASIEDNISHNQNKKEYQLDSPTNVFLFENTSFLFYKSTEVFPKTIAKKINKSLYIVLLKFTLCYDFTNQLIYIIDKDVQTVLPKGSIILEINNSKLPQTIPDLLQIEEKSLRMKISEQSDLFIDTFPESSNSQDDQNNPESSNSQDDQNNVDSILELQIGHLISDVKNFGIRTKVQPQQVWLFTRDGAISSNNPNEGNNYRLNKKISLLKGFGKRLRITNDQVQYLIDTTSGIEIFQRRISSMRKIMNIICIRKSRQDIIQWYECIEMRPLCPHRMHMINTFGVDICEHLMFSFDSEKFIPRVPPPMPRAVPHPFIISFRDKLKNCQEYLLHISETDKTWNVSKKAIAKIEKIQQSQVQNSKHNSNINENTDNHNTCNSDINENTDNTNTSNSNINENTDNTTVPDIIDNTNIISTKFNDIIRSYIDFFKNKKYIPKDDLYQVLSQYFFSDGQTVFLKNMSWDIQMIESICRNQLLILSQGKMFSQQSGDKQDPLFSYINNYIDSNYIIQCKGRKSSTHLNNDNIIDIMKSNS